MTLHARAGDTLLAPARRVPYVASDDSDEPDPTAVRSLAVRVDDVVAALEANERRDAEFVLRATPPFSGRMRARLHREGDDDPPEPLYVPPEEFVGEVPEFPSPDDTEDEIRADPGVEYSRELHRRRHEAAVEEWREAVRGAVVERTTVETAEGPHEVRVTTLE